MKTLDERIEAAEDAERRDEWTLAAGLWSAIFASNEPGRAWGRAGRRAAIAYRKAGDFTKAHESLTAVLGRNPNDPLARRELARLETAIERANAENPYWHQRRDFIYLRVVQQIAVSIAGNAISIVDVGSNGTPILEWFPSATLRVSIDRGKPYAAPRIVSIAADFRNWNPMRRFDVGLCLQVLEHVPEPADFARKLLDLCDVTIVSVPYRWPEEHYAYHLHDPVDEEKLQAWFGRPPNFSYKVTELFGEERIVCVYDKHTTALWPSIDKHDFKYRWSLRGSEKILNVP